MKTYFAFLVLFMMLFYNCSENNSTKISDSIEDIQKETAFTIDMISSLIGKKYPLNDLAKTTVASWKSYDELVAQMGYLEQADLSLFTGDIKLLKDFISRLKPTLSKDLRTPAIESRLGVLETKFLKLHDNLTMSNIDFSLKKQSLQEVFHAYNNLNWRINKKVEKDLFNKIEAE